ncbi:uncharacterized protein GGS22DRAFT_182946 [Annulohypoxylon maeteangense]|uniref:uncharacterized protein n=1 Tax=Annulohypoxylon maeteangense TaxID=1927788 RepID=UPI00200792DF|nr:uncharacterized protein GGS22DRAFT_182946 [Annulohypoxylon maeteangense]KAI0889603.1 hypothetical protein GGS22DRAFT_182946 [Annulohypoxylon maeteangense]
MASRQPQYRQYGGSVERLPLHNGSTLAYDSNSSVKDVRLHESASNKGVDRTLRRVPKDAKLSSSFGNWLGRYKAKKGENLDRIRISDPMPIQQTPSRPKRSSYTPELGNGSHELLRSAAPKPPPRDVEIKRENLGGCHEALRSHPIAPQPSPKERNVATRQTPLKHTAKSGNSKAVAHDEPRTKGTTMEPRQKTDVKTERRKGRIFLDTTDMYEFPNPDTFESSEENDDDGHIWEDAGFDDPQPVTKNESAPKITITQPSDDGYSSMKSEETPQRLLGVDDCYKVLYEGQTKEMRGLRNTLRYLVPLAWLIADAEGVDPNDIDALEGALKTIIADREKLFDLFPLAQVLAEDQKVDIDDFKALPRALQNVMADRDNARRMADYHRMASRRLEGRIAKLERERDSEDNEEYQWL